MSYEVTFTVTDTAVPDEWAFGSLTWTDEDYNYSVRSPIAVLPLGFSTPFLVNGTTDSNGDGSVDVPVIFGYEGPYSATMEGLAESLGQVGNVSEVQVSDEYCADVPPNAFFRAATYNADTTTPGSDDIDIQVCVGNAASCATSTDLLGCFTASLGPTSDESSNIAYPPGGAYFTYVDYYSAAVGTDIDYTLWTTIVNGDEGNTTVTAPASAVLGASETVTVDYTGLNTGGRYAGVLHHNDGSGEIAITILDIDTQ